MLGLVVALFSVLLPLIHIAASKRPRTKERVIRLLLLYALVLDVGVIGLPLGFIPHVFMPNRTAHLIGWPPGSPFQFEVGMHDGAWGVLGFLSLLIGGSFWIATGLGWAIFMLGAAYGHIHQLLLRGNYAPYNFLSIFSDGFVGIWLLILVSLYYHWGIFRERNSETLTQKTRRARSSREGGAEAAHPSAPFQ